MTINQQDIMLKKFFGKNKYLNLYKMNLDLYLKNNNAYVTEGHVNQVQEQVSILKEIVSDLNIKNILQIGFNAGHSTDLFLSSNQECIVTSFDIGEHDYVRTGKEYIDSTYPNRHNLILGNSVLTIPQYYKNNLVAFDLIFIDGSHNYDIALCDLHNCRKLAHKDTIVILDDTIIDNPEYIADHNVGPTRIWQEFKNARLVEELISYTFTHGRGMSIGKYI
jgi:predicted O-methyltransferase YrrM